MVAPAWKRIDKRGRVVIPVEYRRALGLKPGDKFHVTVENGVVRLVAIGASIRRVQEAFRPYRPKGGALRSEELIRSRRADAAGTPS